MALPKYQLRAYRGGGQYLTLSEQLGARTLSINVSGTFTNWPTHTLTTTTGDFCICLTKGTAQEEKVLVTKLTKRTGTFTVWSTGATTGRGYDTTTARTHTPSATIAQVTLVWTATEARESNRAANALFGGNSGTAIVPIGGYLYFQGTPVPTNFLKMTGQKVSKTTYATLAAAVPAWVTGSTITIPSVTHGIVRFK